MMVVPMLPDVEANGPALTRLVEIRLDIERYKTAIWCLRQEAHELRAGMRRTAGPGSRKLSQECRHDRPHDAR